MTPTELEFLIHCYICAAPHPRAHTPSVKEATLRFVAAKIIKPVDQGYITTEKGDVWFKIILSTPMPRQVWVDAQGNKVLPSCGKHVLQDSQGNWF